MTVICSGGGTSSPKPGINTSIFVDQNYIRSLLPPALAFLYPYIPWMNGLAIGDIPTFCGTDPPGVPSLPSPAEFLSFISGGVLSNYLTVNQFLVDLTKRYLWDQICKCDSGATPTAPTPPSDPGNLPAVNPPGIVTLPSTPSCAATGPFHQTLFGAEGNVGLTMEVFFTGLVVTGTRVTLVRSASTGAGAPGTFAVQWFTATAFISSTAFACPVGNGTTVVVLGAPPAGAIQAAVAVNGTGTGTCEFDTTLELFCNGAAPGSTTSPCCPPDPTLIGAIVRLQASLDLLQRQLSPFGYVLGTAHSGLSGNGTIAVADILGVKVDVTTTPSRVGTSDGDPVELFGVGWINLGTGDGFGPRQFIGSDPMIVQPIPGDITVIGYSIPLDVVVTITELVREP